MTVTPLLAATVLAVAAMLCGTALLAWRGWLELKRLELVQRRTAAEGEQEAGVRIELASVRERLKKLEAIASGVEL